MAAALTILYLATRSAPARAQDSGTTIYLPMAAAPADDCNVPGVTYGTVVIASEPTDRPADAHPDLNLAIRGWSPTAAEMSLVRYDGPTDTLAPQLDALFMPDRLPQFSRGYRVNHWYWGCDCRGDPVTDWDVTLLAVTTTPGERLRVPDSGYDIGGGYEVMVLYAAQNRLTLKYSAEDNVVQGYTIHLEDVCVAPDLLALYREMDGSGRERLPALLGRQPFGRAPGDEIRIAIRDNGSFLDPRSEKDWWKEYVEP